MQFKFTSFPEMRAAELGHYVTAALPLHLARLVTSELGSPGFQGKGFQCWYGSADATIFGERVSLPFALTIDNEGRVTCRCNPSHVEPLSYAIGTLIPELVIVDVKPMGDGRFGVAA